MRWGSSLPLAIVSGLALLVAACDPAFQGAPPPSIVGTRAYVQPGCHGLQAVDLVSGSVETMPFGVGYFGPPAAVDHDAYTAIWGYPGHPSMFVVAHDVDRHIERWRTPLPGSVEGIRVFGSGVAALTMVSRDDSRVFMFDGETGAVRWSMPALDLPNVPAEGLVVVLTGTGLEARDPMTGGLRWTVGGSKAIAVTDGVAYTVESRGQLASEAQSLRELDLATGAEKWSLHLADMHSRSTVRGVVPVGDAVALFTSFGLFAVDRSTHKLRLEANCQGGGDARDGVIVCQTKDDGVSSWNAASLASWRSNRDRVPGRSGKNDD